MYIDYSSVTQDFTLQHMPAYFLTSEQRPPESLEWRLPNSVGALPHEIRNTFLALEDLTQLTEDWDGHGAICISPNTVRNTKEILKSMLRFVSAPDVTPNSNGTISLEWESISGLAHLEIGVEKFSLFIKPQIGRPTFMDGISAALYKPEISREIGALIASSLFSNNSHTIPLTRLQFAASGTYFTKHD